MAWRERSRGGTGSRWATGLGGAPAPRQAQPPEPRRPRGRVAQPHLAGRDRTRQPSVNTLYAIAASSTSRSTSCCSRLRDAAGDRVTANRSAAPSGPRRRAEPRSSAPTLKVIRLASGVVWERLTTASDPDVDFLYVTYEVGGASSPEHEFQRHGGREWGYVIDGRLGVTIGFDEHELGPATRSPSTRPSRTASTTPATVPVHGDLVRARRRSLDAGAGERMTGRPAKAVVGHLDWSFAAHPAATRLADVQWPGPAGSSSAGAGRGPHGARGGRPASRRLARPARPLFEEALYVLEGELLLEIDGRVHGTRRRLRADADGTRHALANRDRLRHGSCRSTRRRSGCRPTPDRRHFFEPARGHRRVEAIAERPPFGDPTLASSATTTGRRPRPRRSA